MSPRARFWLTVAVVVALWIAVLLSAAGLASQLEAGRAPGELLWKFWSDGKF